MQIFKIEIENFRLLKDFSLDLEKELSLIIGKNNSGKTSILTILDQFLSQSSKSRLSFDDFNIEFKKELKFLLENDVVIIEENFKPIGIRLRLFIEYGNEDNLTNVSRVMMDLDPNNNVIVLGFEYILDFNGYSQIRKDYKVFEGEEQRKKNENASYTERNIYHFLQLKHENYFRIYRKSLQYNLDTKTVNDQVTIDLDNEKISISEIINFKFISAKREVANKEVNKTLSGQTSRIYERTEISDDQNLAIEQFKETLTETDTQLSEIYEVLFADIIRKVRDFGGIKINESEIDIVSTLQHRELLKGNTTVVYKHDADNSCLNTTMG